LSAPKESILKEISLTDLG